MSEGQVDRVAQDRRILREAQSKGKLATWGAYVRLSGPGWLQSAITLGGGSLSGALFLGVLGGYSMLWLQLVAIVMGVIMLSAISYVTLTTGKKPFQAICEYINPSLAWSWAIGTSLANMIWGMAQYSLTFDALSTTVTQGGVPDTLTSRLVTSFLIFAAGFFVVWLNYRGGTAARIFDWVLKALVGMVVICFFGVVVYMSMQTGLPWGEILAGFVPDLSQWTQPAGDLVGVLANLDEPYREFWTTKVVDSQRDVMIAAAATAVGINMTFLMPYALLNRGWDKTFRGLARFDLSTGMAIPYILVTSCVVIAAASQFHGQLDENLRSDDLAVMKQSDIYESAEPLLLSRVQLEYDAANGEKSFEALAKEEQLQLMTQLPEADKTMAAAVLQRNASQLSSSLAPLLGKEVANNIFGIGVMGMGFSTVIILMLINGYVFSEVLNKPLGGKTHLVGCLVAGLVGASWPFLWDGPSKMWLSILVSAFGMMLLPIAYFTFFFMMNSKKLMGAEKPTGVRMLSWNVLMTISVIGATVAAGSAVWTRINHPVAGPAVIILFVVLLIAVIAGFFLRPKTLKDVN